VHAALVGISPGSIDAPEPLNFSNPPSEPQTGAVFELFTQQKRLDLPALTRAFYTAHPDDFDSLYVWTNFAYDNGLGLSPEFNKKDDIKEIGPPLFSRGPIYGSPERLASLITIGNAGDWPADPQEHMAGLNSAISIVCHEQGHRWLCYIERDGERTIKDSLLGREQSHWSFFLDTRTRSSGEFSSIMEGNSWSAGSSPSVFFTSESAANYFSALDQYLMGLRGPDEVGELAYVVTDDQLTSFLREKSPVSGFSISADRKKATIDQVIAKEGPRVPEVNDSPKEVRVAFILVLENGGTASQAVLSKM